MLISRLNNSVITSWFVNEVESEQEASVTLLLDKDEEHFQAEQSERMNGSFMLS